MEPLYIGMALVILLVILWGYLLSPTRRCTKLEKLPPFAHRGLHDLSRGAPENSLAAFRRAAGYHIGVELDVQITRDGKTVVFHDDTLNRMCGMDGHIYDFTYAELSELRLAGTDERIPLFSQVLAVLQDVPLLCEIKSPRGKTDIAVCADTAAQLDNYKGAVYMESFNPYAMKWFRQNRPALLRGILSMYFQKGNGPDNALLRLFSRNLWLNCIARPDFISYRYCDTRAFSFRLLCKHLRTPCALWTIRTKEDYQSALQIGAAPIFEGFLPDGTEQTGKDLSK